MTTHADVRRPVPAWIWGGGLLAASAALPLVGGAHTVGGLWTGRVLFAAAMVVFAFGLRSQGSVVARRRVGVVALLVLGVVPPLVGLLTPPQVEVSDVWMLQIVGYGQMAIAAGAALVAAVEVARARVVPDPWRWAPSWALAVVAVLYVVPQIALVAVGPAGPADLALSVALIASGAFALVPLALGTVAMLLGARGRSAAPAQIYSSGD